MQASNTQAGNKEAVTYYKRYFLGLVIASLALLQGEAFSRGCPMLGCHVKVGDFIL